MLTAILLASALGTSLDPHGAALEPAAVVLERPERTVFVARTSARRMVGLNASRHTQVLVFRGEAGLPPATIVVAPGASFESRYPRHALDRWTLEVLVLDPFGASSSQALPLQGLMSDRAQALVLERTEPASDALVALRIDEHGSEPWLALPATRTTGIARRLAASGGQALLHAPVVTPATPPQSRRGGPPPIEKHPLPPL